MKSKLTSAPSHQTDVPYDANDKTTVAAFWADATAHRVFFYIISGFRYGFLGEADSPIWVGAGLLLVLNLAMWGLCYALLRSGWKIKN